MFNPHIGYTSYVSGKHKDEKKKRREEGTIEGTKRGRQSQIDALKKEYETIGKDTRDRLLEDRRAAGVSDDAMVGGNSFNSLAQSSTRGARFANRSRLNALEKMLGQEATEWNSATNANTGGVPGSTAGRGDMPIQDIDTTPEAVQATSLDGMDAFDIDPITGKPRVPKKV